MTPPHFLWPRPQVSRALLQSARYAAVSRIEARMSEMFSGAVPVLFSSGRTALNFALQVSGLSRGDMVGVFPYASHCVLDMVSRVATPTTVGCNESLNVIFQQWGYVQHQNLSARDIEDCVDTLATQGAPLFPGGSDFELWSLPKILGTTGGGILWCRSAETAFMLRELRDSRSGSSLLWWLRLLGLRFPLIHACWQGAEALSGRPSRLQTGEILKALDSWSDIVADRKSKLDIAWPLAPNWLSKPRDRLPCVVPVELLATVDGQALAKQAGIASGLRRIERPAVTGHFELTTVLPIPIHQDVTLARLGEMVNCIAPYVRRAT